eukprot:Awhi_evm3s1658
MDRSFFSCDFASFPNSLKELPFQAFGRKFQLEIYPVNHTINPGGIYVRLLKGQQIELQFHLFMYDLISRSKQLKQTKSTERVLYSMEGNSCWGYQNLLQGFKIGPCVFYLVFEANGIDADLNAFTIPKLRPTLFNNSVLADVEVKVSPDDEEKVIYCTKTCLASQSSHFLSLFESKFQKSYQEDASFPKRMKRENDDVKKSSVKRQVIKIKDIGYDACFLVLKYFHTGELELRNSDSLESFLMLKDMYMFVGICNRFDLKPVIESFLTPTIENFGQMMSFAHLYELSRVIQRIEDFVIQEATTQNGKRLLNSKSYEFVLKTRELTILFSEMLLKKLGTFESNYISYYKKKKSY